MSDDRGSCFSITINNPTEADTKCDQPGWSLDGQYEVGAEGTRHFQGILKTGKQVRFSAVKRVFPRAHIEVARNKKALEKYVKKDETRVGEFAGTAIPNMFQFQDTISGVFDMDEINRRWMDEEISKLYKQDINEIALAYIDELVAQHVVQGGRGLEFIAINPMWRSSWKKFWRSIITRHASQSNPSQVCEETISQIPQISPTHAEHRDGWIGPNGQDSGNA